MRCNVSECCSQKDSFYVVGENDVIGVVLIENYGYRKAEVTFKNGNVLHLYDIKSALYRAKGETV